MVKTIKSKSENVVVVGAGLAGLSAAIHLAASGRKVTILERELVPGGKRFRESGFSVIVAVEKGGLAAEAGGSPRVRGGQVSRCLRAARGPPARVAALR